MRERVPDFGAGNRKSPTAVSIEPVARYCKQLTVSGTQVLPSVDTGGRNAVVPTGTVVRGRSDTNELSLLA